MLDIKKLSVAVEGKTILKDVDLQIGKGEVLVLFGPNGSGKTTLIKAIMGFGGYSVKRGQMLFRDKVINNFSIEEREHLGIGIMHQHPPKIRGVKLSQIAQFLCKNEKKIKDLARRLSLEEHLDRDINLGFSGGEMKRSELFQVLLQDPHLLLLDEPESGVDLENISIMGKVLNDYLARQDKSALIITHTGYILDYINAEKGCVMMEGEFWCEGNPKEIFESIKKSGYEKCKECQWQKKS
ncbi:MAG: ATP-binding cassette domain-containing protein [Candidatus Omnitrophota bacterium]|nr:MAG: ATP-binding cassette domain-containing protein [Candidatus Omnitrophota bacterium]